MRRVLEEPQGPTFCDFIPGKRQTARKTLNMLSLLTVGTGESFPHVRTAIEELRRAGVAVSQLFLDCQDEVVSKAF